MAILGLLFLGAVYLLVVVLWSAFVLTQLWTWFIVPLGVISISLAHAYGISLIVTMLTHQHGLAKEKSDGLPSALSLPFLVPLFALFFGWLAHSFM